MGVAVAFSYLVRYRELTITLSAERDQLERSVVQLTRSNLAYLDYALDARQAGVEQERLRITRDIHDIVGYTLTNTMMLMEAAQDLMVDNPLGLPMLIETARTNSQEGLNRVRAAMYQLRERTAQPPVGLSNVARLCRIFAQATGINVTCDVGTAPLSISREVDSAIYHLVQESLVNSFRHGRATEIRATFRCEHRTLLVRVDDNGGGAVQVREGIGIQGMRERIEGVGGTVVVTNALVGFRVQATLPLENAFGEVLKEEG